MKRAFSILVLLLMLARALAESTLTNLAAGKISTGSSVYTGNPPSAFSRGNDGNRDGQYFTGLSVFHSAIPESNPPTYWEVDLGADYHLDRVMIWPRTDVSPPQNTVENFQVSVRSAANQSVWSKNYFPTAAINNVWGTSELRGVVGRYVRIQKLDQNPNFLAFAEFEVWGSPQEGPANLALNKPFAASSSAGFTTLATAGNDGDLGGDYALPGHPIFHSSVSSVGQYWEVDLGQDLELDYAILYNRTDYANNANVALKVRNTAGIEVYSTTVNISRDVIVNGGRQFDLTHEFPPGLTGRFVRLETTGPEYLSFTEVEVFGPVADTLPPVITSTDPPAGALLAELLAAEVHFNEPVTGVQAADLRINGVAATGMTTISPQHYAFQFGTPSNGPVQLTWATGHGITDASGNPFGGAGWSVTVDSSLPAPHPIISEFLADNSGGLQDEDGDSSDWIEIYNPGPLAVNLNGWYLTDDTGLLDKWRIPSLALPAGARKIVFASAKDRAVAGQELHTNFKLEKNGGYLALVKPDGTTVASAWTYPAQRENSSYGIGQSLGTTALLPANATAKYLIPTSSVPGWEQRTFNDAGWTSAPAGLGFDQNTGGGGLLGYWNFNVADNPSVAPDSSGRGNQGNISIANYTGDGGGKSGQPGDRALNFAGNGMMTVPAAATGAFDSSAANDAISLSLWIYGAPVQPTQDFLFYAGGGSDGSGARVLGAHVPWSDSIIYWDTTACCDPALNRVQVGEPNPARWKGQWNHYVFIKNGDTKEIWQNGALLFSGINTADFVPFRSLFLGSFAGGGNGYDGMVDDFAIWNSALSPSEISAIAAGDSPLNARKLNPRVATDLGATMRNVNATAYFRFHFNVADPNGLDILLLRMAYDDGFVAYLNGAEIARRNAPGTTAFNSSATSKRPGGAALTSEEIDVSAYAALLLPGDNVLAIQGMNANAADTEFLIQPELFAGQSLSGRWFVPPTPGSANGAGYLGFTADTSFSTHRGFYDTPQTVTITCVTPGATIIYTTDGSEPSLTNGTQSGAQAIVNITSTTILRAAAFAPGRAPSNIDTHSYLFLNTVGTQTRPPSVPATWPGGAPADFAMDPRIDAGAQPGYTVRDGLLSIPTLSLSLPVESIWGASQGIYANSNGRGPAYERAASIEMLVPGQPTAGFHANCGLRIHGNISRDKGFTPKHGFKVFFRSDYGDAKLESDLFGGGVKKFDQLILRAGSTDTWPCAEWGAVNIGAGGSAAFRWLRPWSSYIRDQWARDAGNAMGQPQARGRFVQLFINGVYWGLYNMTEHPDEDFCADTLGGSAANWDTLKDFTELESGDLAAWNQLINFARAGLGTDAAYQRLLGRNADGTPNAAYNVLLHENSLMDYMILHIFIGADDWPNHNWWAGRRSRGTGGDGFHFFAWDQEISNENHTYERTSWGYVYQDVNADNTPTLVYYAARSNPEFRMRFADRIQRHLFNGGALSQAANVARWNARVAEIDKAVVAESARWGDYQRPAQPYTREAEWLTHLAYMNGTYWPNINQAALNRFTAAGLWPNVTAPALSQHGGSLVLGTPISISNPNGSGTLYYTIDGTDPRAFGGAVAGGAQTYAAPFVPGAATVQARVRSGAGVWSPLTSAIFTIEFDSDHDGLGDVWEQQNGLAIGPNEAALDLDGDGDSNLLEFLAGTDPHALNSRLRFDSVTKANGVVTLKFLARAGRVYRLQRSADVLVWQTIATVPAEAADHQVTLTDPAQPLRQYYRLAPSLP
jgi:hypothetical protein